MWKFIRQLNLEKMKNISHSVKIDWENMCDIKIIFGVEEEEEGIRKWQIIGILVCPTKISQNTKNKLNYSWFITKSKHESISATFCIKFAQTSVIVLFILSKIQAIEVIRSKRSKIVGKMNTKLEFNDDRRSSHKKVQCLSSEITQELWRHAIRTRFLTS